MAPVTVLSQAISIPAILTENQGEHNQETYINLDHNYWSRLAQSGRSFQPMASWAGPTSPPINTAPLYVLCVCFFYQLCYTFCKKV